MNKIPFALALLAAAGFADANPDACTFDLRAVSKAKVEKDDPANPNLLADPIGFRRRDPCIWRPAQKVDTPLEEQEAQRSLFTAERMDDLYAMRTDEAIVKLLGAEKPASWVKNLADMPVAFPDDRGGKYEMRFRYRANHKIGSPQWGAYVSLMKGNEAIVPPEGARYTCRLNIPDTGEDSDYWNSRQGVFTVPPGIREARLELRLDGVGYLKVAGVSLKRQAVVVMPDVSFCVKPYGCIDDRFAVEAGKVGAVEIAWKKSPAYGNEWWKCDLELVMPKGFEFVGANMRNANRAIRRETLADGSERLILPLSNRINPCEETFHDGRAIGLLVRSTGKVGDEGRMTFRVLRGKDQVGEVGSLTLVAVAPFAPAVPKRFRVGAMLSYDLQFFRTDANANAAYADYLREKGVTWIMPQTPWLVEDKALLPMWRAKGFDMITPTDHDYLMNGYKIIGSCRRPPEEDFVPRPGMSDNWAFREHRSTCPAAIYEERPFFVTNIVPHLASRSAGTDGQWVNWEPYFYKGCYCDYCKKKGAEWMAKTGDGNIEHFHSWQHAQIVKTVNKWMKKVEKRGGGGQSINRLIEYSNNRNSSFLISHSPSTPVGLMPAIAWEELASYARENDYPQDKLAKDFAADIAWIPAWGPYIGWSPNEGGYNGTGGKLSAYFFAAKDVRREVDWLYGRGKPKLMAQPAGPNWVVQPEWLEISCAAFFFNGWEAMAPWIFPQGADARHWAAYCRVVDLAAKYEDVVFDGVRCDEKTTLEYAKGYEAKCAWPDRQFLPNVHDVDLIQQVTYDYRGKRYVAAFNFNDEKRAVFTLRTAGHERLCEIPASQCRVYEFEK